MICRNIKEVLFYTACDTSRFKKKNGIHIFVVEKNDIWSHTGVKRLPLRRGV